MKLKKHNFDAVMKTHYHIFCGRNLKLIILSHFHSLRSPIHIFYALTKWLVIIAVVVLIVVTKRRLNEALLS